MAIQRFELSEKDSLNQELATGGSERLGYEYRQLSEGKSRGVETVSIHCGDKTIVVIPTRGMGIWRAENEGIRFGWDSPVDGPVHPHWVPLAEPSGLGWLDGFDELLARCGLSSNGAPEFDQRGSLKWPLHGRIANLPARQVVVEIDEAVGSISVTGIVIETRFHFYRWQLQTTITLRLDTDEIEIVDEVTNLSDRAGAFQLLYHCNFGPPVLEAGSRFHAPVVQTTPRNEHSAAGIEHWREYSAPDSGYSEEVYFLELASDQNGRRLAMVSNADQSLGATVRYGASNLPCFTLWKNTVGLADGYVTGLEPGTNLPNPRSIEEQAGRVVAVKPGEMVSFELSIGMLVGRERVSAIKREIEAIKGVN